MVSPSVGDLVHLPVVEKELAKSILNMERAVFD